MIPEDKSMTDQEKVKDILEFYAYRETAVLNQINRLRGEKLQILWAICQAFPMDDITIDAVIDGFPCDFYINCFQVAIDDKTGAEHMGRSFVNAVDGKFMVGKDPEKYHVWLVDDIQKREIAKEKKIHFLEIYKKGISKDYMMRSLYRCLGWRDKDDHIVEEVPEYEDFDENDIIKQESFEIIYAREEEKLLEKERKLIEREEEKLRLYLIECDRIEALVAIDGYKAIENIRIQEEAETQARLKKMDEYKAINREKAWQEQLRVIETELMPLCNIKHLTFSEKKEAYLTDLAKKIEQASRDEVAALEERNKNRDCELSDLLEEVPGLQMNITDTEVVNELKRLSKAPGNLTASPCNNKIVLRYQEDNFYAYEKRMWSLCPFTRRRLLENRSKYLFKDEEFITDRELLRGFKISGIHTGFSHFSPLWVKYIIEKYKLNSIYDPCGGWGHHVLGIIGTKCTYYYNDLARATARGVAAMVRELNLKCEVSCRDGTLYNRKTDAMFTCPPYENIEEYPGTQKFNSRGDFDSFITTLIENARNNEVKYICIIIKETYEYLIKVPPDYELVENTPLNSSRGHFVRTTKSGTKSGERLYVLRRAW